MEYLTGAFFIVGIVFMCVFMFIGIWSFIVYLKSYRQTRYQNYILEKISQKLSIISDKMSDDNSEDKYSYLTGEEDFDFIDEDSDKINNVTNFNKQENLNK